MLIDIIEHESTSALLSMIERNNRQGGIASLLHVQFATVGIQPTQEQLVLAVKDSLIGFKASIYFCSDGDTFIVWRGTARNTVKQLLMGLQKTYGAELPAGITVMPHQYYDLLAHGEELRILCKQKLQAQQNLAPRSADPSLAAPTPITIGRLPDDFSPMTVGHATGMHSLPRLIEPRLRFSPEQIVTLAQAVEARKERKNPEIMVVEDQTFSRLLLHSSLREHYTTHSTEQAKEAIQLYAEHAPDIVFLDIELPDGSGHQLAELFKRFDPKCFIVMVTAHNQQEEVMRARDNGARAFVIKPYNKQKIFDCIQLFYRNRKKAS